MDEQSEAAKSGVIILGLKAKCCVSLLKGDITTSVIVNTAPIPMYPYTAVPALYFSCVVRVGILENKVILYLDVKTIEVFTEMKKRRINQRLV